MNLPQYLKARYCYLDKAWEDELLANRSKLARSTPSAFTEKCLDANQLNWYIQSLDIFFPKLKEIFVDQKDEDLFREIDNAEGEKIVVVVNQWHMEGIEHTWAHRYGQLPRSVEFENINPIGDMNLRDGLFQRLYNNLHRHIAAGHSGQKPATYADWIIGYHRESNWQYEHRDM